MNNSKIYRTKIEMLNKEELVEMCLSYKKENIILKNKLKEISNIAYNVCGGGNFKG